MLTSGYLLVFITDSIWSLSWLLYAIGSFRLKQSLFPPRLLSLVLAWEFLAVFHSVPLPWSINYYLWIVFTSVNSYLAFRFRSETAARYLLKFAGEIIVYSVAIIVLLWQFQFNNYYILGGSVNVLIALHFLMYLRKTKILNRWILVPHLLRIIAGNVGTVAVWMTLEPQIPLELIFIRAGIFIIDGLWIVHWIRYNFFRVFTYGVKS